MLRVLLVIDDYGELVYLQTLLKKIGFDVDGIQNQRSYEDTQIAFNPEVVIASAKGKRVSGLELAENIRRVRGIPKLVLLVPAALKNKLSEMNLSSVDATLDSPADAKTLLETLADVGQLDKASLVDKYMKIRPQLPGEDNQGQAPQPTPENHEDAELVARESGSTATASGGLIRPSKLSESERKQRFAKALAETEKPEFDGFPRERVAQFNKQIRKAEDADQLKDLEEERQEFVKALFRKPESED